MPLALILLAPALAGAAPAVRVPRPAPPRILPVSVPPIPWWNSAERARVAARSPFTIPAGALAAPKPLPLLLPYPALAPPSGRSHFLLQ